MVIDLVRREYWLVIAVVTLVPALFALLAYRVAMSRRFVAWLRIEEPSPAFLGALTLPFALFFAFMISDIWNREHQLARAVQQESQRLMSGLDLVALCGAPCKPAGDAIHDYARVLSDTEWAPGWVPLQPQAEAALMRILKELVGLEQNPQASPAVRSGLVSMLSALRALRSERHGLLHVELGPRRGMMVLLLGFITQFGIAVTNAGRRAGLMVALSTFTLAFVVTLNYAITVGWPTVDETIIPAADLARLLGP
ncbi:MAG TPA: hypothetical protein VLA00_01710 [Xanthobacteraceae bacterium]|nr:hypothetical protein [Xanthobacteraceae bacterium]